MHVKSVCKYLFNTRYLWLSYNPVLVIRQACKHGLGLNPGLTGFRPHSIINGMVICIDRFLSDQYSSGYRLFIEDLMEELARRNSTHRFIWLTADPQAAGANLVPNITIYPVNSWVLRWVGKKWWYRLGLPRLLKKLRADRFVEAEEWLMPAVPVSSCLFLPFVPSGRQAHKKRRSGQPGAAFRRAKRLVVFTRYHQKRMLEDYPAVADKIVFLPPAAIHPVAPLTLEEREAAKTEFAGGLEYFAFAGDLREEHLLTMLLKAFSIFKKWQRSNMQLVIAGHTTAWTQRWMTTVDSYKYRKDVHIIRDPPKGALQAVVAGAYAVIYPALHDHVPVNILHALHAGVPVISSSMPVVEEIAGEAALYAAGNDENSFAAAMQALYKDERLRDSLILKGRKQLEDKEADTVKTCWEIIETG